MSDEPTMTTIEGGQDIKVLFNNGEKEFVKVRQLPVKLMSKYAQTISDDAAAVELYCDKAEGWAQSLTPESFNAVADLGLELNLDFFGAWFRRQKKIAETMNPGVNEKIQRELNDALLHAGNRQTSPSPDSSPASRSVAD